MSSEVSNRKAFCERSAARPGAGSPKRAASKRCPKGVSSRKDTTSARDCPDQCCHLPHRSRRVSLGATSMTTPRQRSSMKKPPEVSPLPQTRKSRNAPNDFEDIRKLVCDRVQSEESSPPKSPQKSSRHGRSVESPRPPWRGGSPNYLAFRELSPGKRKDGSPKRAAIRSTSPPCPSSEIKQHMHKECESPTSQRERQCSPKSLPAARQGSRSRRTQIGTEHMIVDCEGDNYELSENSPSWRFRSPKGAKQKSPEESSSAACIAVLKKEESVSETTVRRLLHACERLRIEAEETLEKGAPQFQRNVGLDAKFSVTLKTAYELMERVADEAGRADVKRLAREGQKMQQRKVEQTRFDQSNVISQDRMNKCLISKPSTRDRASSLSPRWADPRASPPTSEKINEVESFINVVSEIDSLPTAQEASSDTMPSKRQHTSADVDTLLQSESFGQACELMERVAAVYGRDDLGRLAFEAKKMRQCKVESCVSQEGVDNCISEQTPRVRTLAFSPLRAEPRLTREVDVPSDLVSKFELSRSAQEAAQSCSLSQSPPSPNHVLSKFELSRSAQEGAQSYSLSQFPPSPNHVINHMARITPTLEAGSAFSATDSISSLARRASLASPSSPSSAHGVSTIASSCRSIGTISSLGSAGSVTSTTASCSDVPRKRNRKETTSQTSLRLEKECELLDAALHVFQTSQCVFQPTPCVSESQNSPSRTNVSIRAPSYSPRYVFQQVTPQSIETSQTPIQINGSCSPAAPHQSPRARSVVVPITNWSGLHSAPQAMQGGSLTVPRIADRSGSSSVPQTINRPGSLEVPSTLSQPLRRPSLSSPSSSASQGVGHLVEILQRWQDVPGLVVDELEVDSFEADCPSLKCAWTTKLGLPDDVTIQRMSTHGGLNMGIYTAQAASSTLILKFVTSTRYMGLPTEAELLLTLVQKMPSIVFDRDVAFPIGIFLLTDSRETRNLIVMKKVPGQALADIISRRLHFGQGHDVKTILHRFGRFLSIFHERYRMQHGDCQAGNVFYDESSGRFSLIDLSDMGSPLVKTLDVDHFCVGLQGLMRKHDQNLYGECSVAFKTGYSALAA